MWREFGSKNLSEESNLMLIKHSLVMATLITLSLSVKVFADCGQFVIVRVRVNVNVNTGVPIVPNTPPPSAPPSVPGFNQSNSASINQSNNASVGGTNQTSPNFASYPSDVPGHLIDGIGVKGTSFKEPNQYAVIAWNGSEEVLWISTRQESVLPGNGAALSILPLPGTPISVTKGDEKLYANCANAVTSKLANAGGYVVLEAQIGAHNVFVLESNSVADLEKQIQDYVDKKFSGEADGLIGEYARGVLKDYVNRGFKYFAFDLIRSTNSAEIKVPIQYHFKSNALYYPMVVSKIGGEGMTTIEAVVFTKGGVTGPAPGAKALDFNKVKGSRAASFSNEELKGLDPALGKLFGTGGAAGRAWYIQGDMKSFDGDIYYR